MRIISRSSGYASALLLAGTAALAAPAAAQASAALPGPPVVPCSSSALVAAIQQANSARFATLVLSRGCDYVLTKAVSGKDGLPPITGNLVVLGSGGTTISRSSSAAFRIFDVAAGAGSPWRTSPWPTGTPATRWAAASLMRAPSYCGTSG